MFSILCFPLAWKWKFANVWLNIFLGILMWCEYLSPSHHHLMFLIGGPDLSSLFPSFTQTWLILYVSLIQDSIITWAHSARCRAEIKGKDYTYKLAFFSTVHLSYPQEKTSFSVIIHSFANLIYKRTIYSKQVKESRE